MEKKEVVPFRRFNGGVGRKAQVSDHLRKISDLMIKGLQ